MNKEIGIVFGVVDQDPHPLIRHSLFDKLLSDKFKITLFASTVLLTPMPNLCNFLRWTFLTEDNLIYTFGNINAERHLKSNKLSFDR